MDYYYILSTQKNLLQNEVLEEVLREKSNYFKEQKVNRNFWLIISPDTLLKKETTFQKIKETNFYKQNKPEIDSLCSIVSYDKKFIDWLALRLGYFESIDKIPNQSGSFSLVSNGLVGKIETIGQNPSILKGGKENLSSAIIFLKIKKIIEKLVKF